MSEMIDRVARSMQDKGTPSFTCTWEDCARAAIEAMREPTKAMALTGYPGHAGYGDVEAAATWRKMIDEALKP